MENSWFAFKTLYNIWNIKTPEVAANPAGSLPNAHDSATKTSGATFQINSTNFFVPVITFAINNEIKFSENLKQGFKRKIYLNKYRFEITTQSKNKNLDYMGDPTFKNINRLFLLSFKNGDNDPTRNSFNKNYMPSVKIKIFMH